MPNAETRLQPQAIANLRDSLPPLLRLSLAYAPEKARLPLLALFALDTRLAAIVRTARDPALAQIRLAWWRERLGESATQWPSGEPLLAALAGWQGQHAELAGLVDSWEGLVDPPPLAAATFASLAEARGQAFGALASLMEVGTCHADAVSQGRNWALADLAAGVTDAAEQAHLAMLIAAQDWTPTPLPSALRALAVLHGLARRSVRKGVSLRDMSVGSLGLAVRLGLFGR